MTAPGRGSKSPERDDAPDTPEHVQSVASAAGRPAAGPNTFQRVDPSRLPPGQMAGVTPRPRWSSVPPAGESKGWGRSPRSYGLGGRVPRAVPPRFGPRCPTPAGRGRHPKRLGSEAVTPGWQSGSNPRHAHPLRVRSVSPPFGGTLPGPADGFASFSVRSEQLGPYCPGLSSPGTWPRRTTSASATGGRPSGRSGTPTARAPAACRPSAPYATRRLPHRRLVARLTRRCIRLRCCCGRHLARPRHEHVLKFRLSGRGVKPSGICLARQDHRHQVMVLRHHLV